MIRSLLVLLSLLFCAGLARAADSQDENTAWNLYRVRCALCHYIDRDSTKFAPSLKDLFKRSTLLNGKPVTEQDVSDWIANGSANMPAFRYTLDQKEIQLIVAYLKGNFTKQGAK